MWCRAIKLHFIKFPVLFHPPLETISEGPCADLTPKKYLFMDLGSHPESKIDPWSVLFNQKSNFRYPASLRAASWSRSWHELAPKTFRGCIVIDSGTVLVDFANVLINALLSSVPPNIQKGSAGDAKRLQLYSIVNLHNFVRLYKLIKI